MDVDEEDVRLREEGDRIEALLDELASMAGPQTFERIEELLRHTVSLYGAGLRRVLEHVHGVGALDAKLEVGAHPVERIPHPVGGRCGMQA